MLKAEDQLEVLRRGTVQIVSEDELLAKIRSSIKTGRPMRVKLGVDASAPDIHIGHAVPLRKLRQFQDLGHEVFFIIGDFTGRIGDPSGRSDTRKQLSEEEVRANARTYQEQVYKILDPQKTRLCLNSEWLGALDFADVVRLGATTTVARMLERDDFQERFRQGYPISVHEFMYPLAQAYDSIATEADVEIGGTDQTFNLLMGRDIQREYGQAPQVVMTLPLLEGTDGIQKMSKSLGNYIGINDPPDEIFGRTMSIPDSLITKYFELATDVPMEEIGRLGRAMASGEMNPRDAKMQLAGEIVSLYAGAEAARQARDNFIRVFSEKELPEDIPVWTPAAEEASAGEMPVAKLLVSAGLAPSTSEAKRLVAQGGVRVNDDRIEDDRHPVRLVPGTIVRVGKRRIVRIG
ncbi:MAG: tyrosine--tRNA ligase [Bacillota bacterium]|nr:tyrosine--tRNA ligase [Bacillota bacterium]